MMLRRPCHRHAWVGVACLAVLGCGRPVVRGPDPGRATGPAAGQRPRPVPPPPNFGLPDPSDAGVVDGGSGAIAPPRPGEQCAEEVKAANLAPVDLLLLLDASGSMAEKAGARTRWELARDALTAFVRDPRSAGLGVGVQLFPLHTRTCQDDGTCFLPSPGGCRVFSACLAPGAGLAAGTACGAPGDQPCAPGTACVQLGRCSVSGGDCVGLGQPCPSGVPDDLCGPRPRQCRLGPSSRGSCDSADYRMPTVPILDLPAGAARVVGAMETRLPIGATQLGVALQGVLAHLRARLQANPTRRTALVLVSDGLPQGCVVSNDVAPELLAASSAVPAIPTYMIGVFAADEPPEVRATVERFAMAGGTGAPIIVTPNDQLAEKFLAALEQVRGAAVPCDLPIPVPTSGAIDFGKVNVRANGGNGATDLVYVPARDRCTPGVDGWYYDVDPAIGPPGRVHLCPAVCDRLKADPQASLELRFGCRSRTID
jgi:hypothetical protein